MKKNKKIAIKEPEICNHINELSILDKEYWENKASIGYNSDYFNNKKIPKPSIFEYAPDIIKKDKDINIIAITKGSEHLFDVDKSLLGNKEFILELLDHQKYISSFSLSPEIKNDPDIFVKMCIKDPWQYKSASFNNRTNKELVLKIVEKNYQVVEFLEKSLKNDVAIALSSVKNDPRALMFINKTMRNKIFTDEEGNDGRINANEFVKEYHDYFHFLGKLLNKPLFVMPHLIKTHYLVKYAGDKIKSDKQLMLKLCDKQVVNYASNELKEDAEFGLQAIMKNSLNFNYLSESLKEDRVFCLNVLQHDLSLYRKLNVNIKRDPEIIKVALEDEKNINALPQDIIMRFEKEALRKNQTIYDIANLEYLTMKLSHELENKPKSQKIKI